MNFNKDDAAFVIAVYVADLPRWSTEDEDGNRERALQLAADLGVRGLVDRELRGLGVDL